MNTTDLYRKFADEHDDVGMFSHPECWPNNAILPVKTYNGVSRGQMPRCGLLLNPNIFEDVQFTVFETDMFDKDFSNCPKHKFKSYAEIAAAGWEVD